MRRGVSMLVLAVAAGCTGGDGGANSKPEHGVAVAPLAAPLWSIGDWWTYQISGFDPVTWVVTEDLGDAWMVDIDDEEWAFEHAAFGQVSTIGAVSKAHLDGSQEHGAVHFFDFPLVQNKTWGLTWDGLSWDATVVAVTADTAEVRAQAPSGEERHYVYDNETAWFRSIVAYDANGTQEFRVDLSQSGRGYTGTYARWTIHAMHEFDVVPGGVLVEEFEVPGDATDIWYGWQVVCNPDGLEGDQGGGIFEAHPGDDGQYGISVHHVCPGSDGGQGTLDPHPPSWGVTAASAGAAFEAVFIPRTLQELRL